MEGARCASGSTILMKFVPFKSLQLHMSTRAIRLIGMSRGIAYRPDVRGCRRPCGQHVWHGRRKRNACPDLTLCDFVFVFSRMRGSALRVLVHHPFSPRLDTASQVYTQYQTFPLSICPPPPPGFVYSKVLEVGELVCFPKI